MALTFRLQSARMNSNTNQTGKRGERILTSTASGTANRSWWGLHVIWFVSPKGFTREAPEAKHIRQWQEEYTSFPCRRKLLQLYINKHMHVK